MDNRIVALFMAVLVIVVGFFVIRSVMDGTGAITPNVTDTVECQIQQGTCVEQGTCQEIISETLCGEGAVCCRSPG